MIALSRESVYKKSLFLSTASLHFTWLTFLGTGRLLLREGRRVSPAGKGSATRTAEPRAILPLIRAAFPWCLARACGGWCILPQWTERFYLLLLAPRARALGGDAAGSRLQFPTAKHTNTIDFKRVSCRFQLDVFSEPHGAITKVFFPRVPVPSGAARNVSTSNECPSTGDGL